MKVQTDVATLRPLADRVIVRPIEPAPETASGIYLPPSSEKTQEGTVLAVGPGRVDETGTTHPVNLAVGDRVLYAKYAGTEVTLRDEQTVLVLREGDVLAVVG